MRRIFPIIGILAFAFFQPLEIFGAGSSGAPFHPAVIPLPANVEWREGLLPADRAKEAVRFVHAGGLPTEGYEIEITPTGAVVRSSSDAGAFYASQTLDQLRLGDGSLPCVSIRDEPRFSWRGLMLDCSRTFQSLDYLHKTIDRLAAYKMNVLHLHLTDDQGWRLEIAKYPELTQKGARFSAKYNEPESHQGFFSQQQLRELVAYAAQRGVTLVPEIEMPGHSLAALVCHPELSCTGKIPDDIFPFGNGPGITHDIFCAGNDETFKFIENVLDEVIEIFPSEFIHIGGDEAPKTRWKACEKCQARIKAKGLKNEHELQSYFIRRIEKHINAKGRRLIGWSEILQGGLAPNAAVMDWIGGAAAATKEGHDAVMSPTSHCYFDYSYAAISSARAFSFDPVAKLLPEQAKHELGLQANFWSHIDREPKLVDRQLFPRLLAIAERGWSPASDNDVTNFEARLAAQLPRLRQMGVHYRPEPAGHWTPQQVTEEYAPLLCDVSRTLTAAGRYRVTLQYTKGKCRLGIESVELLAKGEIVSADRHRGVTGASHEANSYIVELKEHKPGTKYELRVSSRSEGGTDSSGDIFVEAQ